MAVRYIFKALNDYVAHSLRIFCHNNQYQNYLFEAHIIFIEF
ncbi:hypothetical protein VAE115_290101 [Vibrio aestuarianus]|nr:hypothetical protein VAE115_290101 [Vibrio aestuarianus]